MEAERLLMCQASSSIEPLRVGGRPASSFLCRGRECKSDPRSELLLQKQIHFICNQHDAFPFSHPDASCCYSLLSASTREMRKGHMHSTGCRWQLHRRRQDLNKGAYSFSVAKLYLLECTDNQYRILSNAGWRMHAHRARDRV